MIGSGWLRRPRLLAPLGTVLACALLLGGLGYGAYRHQGAQVRREGQERLAYEAGEKAGRIDDWLQERIGDALVTSRDPLLVDRLRHPGPEGRPGPALVRALDLRLAGLTQAYHYDSALLLGPGGAPLAGAGPLLPWEARELAAAGADPGVRVVWTLQPGAGPGLRLGAACLAPIVDPDRARRLGTLVLRLRAGSQLGRALGAQAGPTRSGEVLLLARQGPGGWVLNRTRRPGAPVLQVPLDRPDLVEAQALLRGDGLKQGAGLGPAGRDVPAVGFALGLQGMPWMVLAKVDRDEFMGPTRRLTLVYSGLGVVFLLLLAAVLVAWHDREQASLAGLQAESRALGSQLADLSRFSNEIVLVLDPSGRVLEANEVAEAAYQLSRAELCARRIQDLRAPEAGTDFQGQFSDVLRQGSVRFRTVHRRRDGSCFPVAVSSLGFELEGRPLVRSLLLDISEQVAAEARSRSLNEELERRVLERTAQLEAALREMEAFSYSVSHDLRGPLRGIDGFSLALLEDFGGRLDDRGRHYLQRIRHGAQAMGQIMDDLLDLSRLSRKDLVREPVDLSGQARAILADLARQAPDRPLRAVVQDGLAVRADPRLMAMVLDQLLANAWKYSGRCPEPRIEVGRVAGGPASDPVFFVKDNGVGFDMAYAGKLFTAFQRLHDIAQFPGSGIGLTIVQRILVRHGGRVWAESEVDRGATFFFTLPA